MAHQAHSHLSLRQASSILCRCSSSRTSARAEGASRSYTTLAFNPALTPSSPIVPWRHALHAEVSRSVGNPTIYARVIWADAVSCALVYRLADLACHWEDSDSVVQEMYSNVSLPLLLFLIALRADLSVFAWGARA